MLDPSAKCWVLGAVAVALGAAGDPCRLPAWLGPWLLEVFGVKKNFNCLAEVFGAPFQCWVLGAGCWVLGNVNTTKKAME